jgi:hypothetical protein
LAGASKDAASAPRTEVEIVAASVAHQDLPDRQLGAGGVDTQ